MSEFPPEQIIDSGSNNRNGNLLGIQPFMTPLDYVSEGSFYSKLNHSMHLASQKGMINERTVVIFPEYIGTWLVVTGENPSVYKSNNLNQAIVFVVINNLWKLARTIITSKEKDKIKAGLFRVKSKQMVKIYQNVFSRLANNYQCTLVGGSILLPAPLVIDGTLKITDGPLFNVSVLYRKDGSADGNIVHKIIPIPSESTFISAGSFNELPVFDTPAGRLGVLICADSWFPAAYDRLNQLGIEMIAVPSYVSGVSVWDSPWHGYIGAPSPVDVDQDDIGRITEGQAWQKYALNGRISMTNARSGIVASLNGQLWDIGCDGRSSMIQDKTSVYSDGIGPALLNLWLP